MINLMKRVHYILNFLILAVFIYMASKQIKIMYQNTQVEDVKIPQTVVTEISQNKKISFPYKNSNSLILVWASWCAPCKLEMYRLEQSVKNKKIEASQIIALNPYESDAEIQSFVQENKYSFRFINSANMILKDVPIAATPTFILLEGEKVERVSTGINIIGILRIERFLSHKK